MNNVYCVCTTPSIYPHYSAHWNNFKDTNKELRWLCDVTNDKDFSLDFDYTEDDIRKNLNFNKTLSTKHFWNCTGRRNIIWFYAHFRMLNFYLQNMDYDYYWFFDDDVRADNWVEFFKGFEDDDSDFISYFVFKNHNVETQPNVPKIDDKTYSNQQWFYRFPGDGDVLPNNVTELFGSFFPVVRFSKKAMETLLEFHKNGYDAYSEGFVPTILNFTNHKISSLYTPENKSNFFDDNIVNLKHKNSKIEWSWI